MVGESPPLVPPLARVSSSFGLRGLRATVAGAELVHMGRSRPLPWFLGHGFAARGTKRPAERLHHNGDKDRNANDKGGGDMLVMMAVIIRTCDNDNHNSIII